MIQKKLPLALKGMAMGIAEVIPGVSGGTIAFITGIYEELINTITAFGPEGYAAYKEGGISNLWKTINGEFLVYLMGGMVFGAIIGVFGITYLLDHYPEPLWGFFFGLIIASSIYMAKQIEKWDIMKILAIIIGAIVAYGITIISPAEGSTSPLYIFISGVIAISALILPGISGSFILLLMGMYTIIIPTIKQFLKTQDTASFIVLAIFGSGCLVGILGFSRVLKWLFSKYKEVSFALLTGFLIGALNKIWPWRNVSQILDKESGNIMIVKDLTNFHSLDPENIKILQEINVMPTAYLMAAPNTIVTIISIIIGFCAVFLLERLQIKK
ncbi:MAG: DUF368 domain-containing protein [Saprospiraceae bacterium]